MKKNLNKVLALTLAFTVVGSTAAYAEVMKGETTATPVPISTEADDQAEASAYISNTGKITEVADTEDGNKVFTMDNENGGLRFVVSPTTTIVDRETGSVITADKLTEGMEVAVIYGAMAPMGMSMPPYMGQVTAVVANADKGSISVGHFNDDLLNEKDLLQLNISEDTTILTTLGTKSILSADDVKGKDAVVFYDITTRSIPAQTNPSLVLLLEEREAATEDTEEAAVDTKSVEAPEMVALRDAAEAKGYSVKWQGKTAPVVLEKDGMTAQITLGSTTYVVEGDMAMTSSAAAELTDGVLYVSADVVENLK
ncbi:copper amine oxidase N-terminal domain-containing protein [Anaerotignum lactatifermentans]|uniref:Copper amine oxidase N-terminal domain-containing protein n=1 Tax=Anaerotignum lactatifermentans DSM 14214 TaxID=1121323 RepID=A0A1M6K8Q9_9FIRM|nr:copper amine oxidase N-terminal domain-containing protein [Anaerotignum lactatifermentans]SHJ55240.1 Copper amine oxidase N-terminal domain-containing protein [[Clostridium] lactatifermentans DSM 14214] [Anaerotignum lactatifermentans DSM 14214]